MKNNKQFAAVIAAVMAAGMTFSAAAADTSFTIDMEKNADSAWKNVAMANDDTVTTGALIRQNPETDANVTGYLYRGGAVRVLWKGENWTEVESGGVHGYIRNDCLVYGDEAKGLAEHYGEYAAKASWNDVSVLTEGNANAQILEKAGDGDTYKVTCKDGHWFEVKTEDNKTAFLSEDDIDLVLLVDTAVDVNGERGSRGSSSSAERTSEPAQAAAEPAAQEPAYEEPAYQEPAYQEPAYQEPAYQEPAYQEPAYQEPAYEEPAYQEPSYEEPASQDTAAADDGSGEYIYDETPAADDTAAADYTETTSEDYTDDTASADYTDDAAAADYSDETASTDYSDDAAADDYSYDETADDQEVWDDGAVDSDEIYEDTSGETYYEESYDDAAYTDDTATYDTYDEYTEDGTAYTDDGSDYSDSGSDTSSTSSSDLDLLAAIIYHEAGNQPTEGKIAVGAVVLNRVYSSLFPNTISEVLYQSGQFTPAGELAGTIASGVPSDSYDAANQALAGNDPTGGCLYFNTSHGSGVHIGAHWFY